MTTQKEFKCPRCGYDTNYKAHYIKHLNILTPCPTTLSSLSREDIIKAIYKPELKGMTVECSWCKKLITKKNVLRHQTTCRDKPVNQEEASTSTVIVEHQPPIASLVMNDKDAFNQLKEDVKNEILNDLVTINNLSASQPSKQPQVENNYDFTQEKFFQKVLESIYGGSHMKFEGGESDITTDDAHVEIKRWTCWKEIEGQLSAYNYFSKRNKLIACCFGSYQDFNKNIAYQVLTSKGIEVFDCQFCEKTRIFTYTNMTTNDQREILLMNV